MNKKSLYESDSCDKFTRPAMEAAGWHRLDQIYREFSLRAGRVVVRGRQARRDASTVPWADYALFFKLNIPLAGVEARSLGRRLAHPDGPVQTRPASDHHGRCEHGRHQGAEFLHRALFVDHAAHTRLAHFCIQRFGDVARGDHDRQVDPDLRRRAREFEHRALRHFEVDEQQIEGLRRLAQGRSARRGSLWQLTR